MGVASFSFRVWGCPPTFAKGTSIFFYYYYFFSLSHALTPHAYAPPWTPLNPGFCYISGGCRNNHLFARQSAMESSVVSSLPDHAFTPTLESMGWNDQLRNTLHLVSHIVDCSPSALLPSGPM